MRSGLPITSQEQREILYRVRYDSASIALGINENTRSVYWVLLATGKSWNVSGLVKESGRSRTTIQRIVARGVERGHMTERGGMYCLTDLGQGVALRLHRETKLIATGNQRGFTAKLIQVFRNMGRRSVKKEAATISFKK